MEFPFTLVESFKCAEGCIQFHFSKELLKDAPDLHNIDISFSDIESFEYRSKRYGESWQFKVKGLEYNVVKWGCPARQWQEFSQCLERELIPASIHLIGPGFTTGYKRLAFLGIVFFILPIAVFLPLWRMTGPIWAWAILGMSWFMSLMLCMMSREYHTVSKILWPIVFALGLVLIGLIYFGVIKTGI